MERAARSAISRYYRMSLGLHSMGRCRPEQSGAPYVVVITVAGAIGIVATSSSVLKNERSVAQFLLDNAHKLAFRVSEDLCQVLCDVQANSNER